MDIVISRIDGAHEAMLSHRPPRPARARTLGLTPPGSRSASRILGVFLDDIDHLVHAEESAKALQLAVLLPHVVAALEDPALSGRCEAADAWVAQWLTGDAADPRLAAWRSTWHRGCDSASHRSAVTQAGIKQLRLRRHSRDSISSAVPRGGVDFLPPPGSDLRLAHDLILAARHWYSEVGMDDARVQENLSRLAVLRGANLSG